jgi:hypothetical protein
MMMESGGEQRQLRRAEDRVEILAELQLELVHQAEMQMRTIRGLEQQIDELKRIVRATRASWRGQQA